MTNYITRKDILKNAIITIIKNKKVGSQADISKILDKNGIKNTQSNISRILANIGAIRIINGKGKSKEYSYILMEKPLDTGTPIKKLINEIKIIDNYILIDCYKNSSYLLKQILEERKIQEINYMIGGESFLMIYPKDKNEIEKLKEIVVKKIFLD